MSEDSDYYMNWAERVTMNVESDPESIEPEDEDRDPANVMVRAGYLFGLAMKQPEGDDRTFLFRAARSLVAYGGLLESLRAAEIEGEP